MHVLVDLVRSHTPEYVNRVRTLYPTTGLRLRPPLDSLQCDSATCSRTQVPFTIHVLGKRLSFVKLDDSHQFYFVALPLLFTAYTH